MSNSLVNTNRQSNIELLRIISMFLIVIYHVFVYVLGNYETQYLLIKPLYTLSHVGVVIFVLISGYFGIKPSVKGLLKLYLWIVFYNLLLFCPWYFIGKNEFSLGILVKIFMPFSHSLPWLWFMRVYVFLYLLSPLLNVVRNGNHKCELSCFGKKPNRGGNILIISGLGIMLFWFGWINSNSDLYDGRNIIEFAFLYLLGGLLRNKYVVNDENRTALRRKFGIWLLVLVLAVSASLYFAEGSYLQLFKHICHPNSSPVLITMSALILLLFSTFKIQSSVINWISSSTLSVYLVHENRFFEFIPWYDYIEDKFLHCSGLQFVFIFFAGVMVIFTCSILTDKIRLLIMKPIDILYDKIQKRILI